MELELLDACTVSRQEEVVGRHACRVVPVYLVGQQIGVGRTEVD